jgi:hypothetical protein
MHGHLNVKFFNVARVSPGCRVVSASNRWSTSHDGESADLRTPADMQKACSHLWRGRIRRNITGLMLRLREIDGIFLKQRENKQHYRLYIV